jgi:hypothetical protein
MSDDIKDETPISIPKKPAGRPVVKKKKRRPQATQVIPQKELVRMDLVDAEFESEEISDESDFNSIKRELLKCENSSSFDKLILSLELRKQYTIQFVSKKNINYYLERGFRYLRRKEVSNLDVIDTHAEAGSGDRSQDAIVQYGSLTGMLVSKVRQDALRSIYADESSDNVETMTKKSKNRFEGDESQAERYLAENSNFLNK